MCGYVLCPQTDSRLTEGRDHVPGLQRSLILTLLVRGVVSQGGGSPWLGQTARWRSSPQAETKESWESHIIWRPELWDLGRAASIAPGVLGKWGEGIKVNDFHLHLVCQIYKWGLCFLWECCLMLGRDGYLCRGKGLTSSKSSQVNRQISLVFFSWSPQLITAVTFYCTTACVRSWSSRIQILGKPGIASPSVLLFNMFFDPPYAQNGEQKIIWQQQQNNIWIHGRREASSSAAPAHFS